MVLGASKKEQELLLKMGIVNQEALLDHFPRRYEDFSLTPKEAIYSMKQGQKAVFYGTLSGTIKNYRFAKASKATFYFRNSYGFDVFFVAWNRPFLGKALLPNEFYTVQGSYDEKEHCFNLMSFKKGKIENTLVPVYSLPNDFPEHRFHRLIDLALEGDIPDRLPEGLEQKYRLPHRKDAYRFTHHPHSKEELAQGYRYFKYEEALLFCLKNQQIKKENKALVKKTPAKINREALDSFIKKLPYPLTSDQAKAVEEATQDMDAPTVMNRLLQGDVGTGKTLVAAVLAYANFTRYRQTALMAPTEALARQHAHTLRQLYRGKLNVALLLGSTSASERRALLQSIQEGFVDVIVGTHVLFSKDVFYASLGLVLIDEQHKFGVNQRVALLGKGEEADLLLMTATPIPRTLALTLYGDMDVSTLEVFPAARRSVTTWVLPPKDPRIKRSIDHVLQSGGQIYVVAPQIEESDRPGFLSAKKLYEGYAKVYPEEAVLLHGKMSAEEKEAALALFVSGEKKILVATSLIEVGIDVPKARLLIVYEATHFSLSSLHQLRGRVGRDGSKAACYLIDSGDDPEGTEKLNILAKTDDGFEIAKEDLSMRGFGELSGTKQSGLLDLRFASVVDDYRMFQCAYEDAKSILDHPKAPRHGYWITLAKTMTITRG